jgi:hypothetical protein
MYHYFLKIILQHPESLVSFLQFFTTVTGEVRILHSYCCTICDIPGVASLAQRKTCPLGKVSTVGFNIQIPSCITETAT